MDKQIKERLFSELEADDLDINPGLIKSARHGDARALYKIGMEYYYYQAQRDKSLDWFILSAEKDYIIAQHKLGEIYNTVPYLGGDLLIAFSWYLKAAKQFSTDSWFRLAQMFERGDGIPKNKYKALEWYHRVDSKPQIKWLEKCGLHLKEHDKNRSVNLLLKETEDILNTEMERRNQLAEETKLKPEPKPKSKKPTKEELKQNFDPFIFHAKRK